MKKVKKNAKIILLILLSIAIVSSLLFVYACFAPYGRHKAGNTEALKTDKIIDPPDSVAVIRGGVAIKVSDEKRDQIYAAFVQVFEEHQSNEAWMCSIGPLRTAKCLMFNMSVEFRYEQTRQISRQEYDAVLFSFEEDDVLIPIYLCDGRYNYNNSYRTWAYLLI